MQRNFRNPKYNNGQYDKYEGAILQGPCAFVYHVGKDERRVDFEQSLRDDFEAVYHKVETYSIENNF